MRDLENGAPLLRRLPYCSGKIGSVGFCMGGRSALLFVCSSDKVDATIDCWGGGISSDSPTTPQHPVPFVELVKNLKRPVYAGFGADDENSSQAHAAELRDRFDRESKFGPRHHGNVLLMPNTPFSLTYVRSATGKKPAFELWPKMVDFFKKHLL